MRPHPVAIKRRQGWGTRTAEAVHLSEAGLFGGASGFIGGVRFGLSVGLFFLPFAARKDGAVAWVSMRGIARRHNDGDSGLARGAVQNDAVGREGAWGLRSG